MFLFLRSSHARCAIAVVSCRQQTQRAVSDLNADALNSFAVEKDVSHRSLLTHFVNMRGMEFLQEHFVFMHELSCKINFHPPPQQQVAASRPLSANENFCSSFSKTQTSMHGGSCWKHQAGQSHFTSVEVLFGSPLARTGAGVTLCGCVVSLLIRSHGGAGSISLTCWARRALEVDLSRLLLECSRFLGPQLTVHVDLAATRVSTMLQKDSSDNIKINQARAREQISKWSASCLSRNRFAGAEICGNQQLDAHSV